MFNFLKPKPKLHVTPEDQQWLESNLSWLRGQFGAQPFARLPLTGISGPFSRNKNDLTVAMPYFFEEVCIHMDIDPDDISLHSYSDGAQDGLNGPVIIKSLGSQSMGEYHHRNHLTGKFDIHLNTEITKDYGRMLSVIAHELSHVRLLGEGRLHQGEETMEYVTDLCAIYFGFGVMMANSCHMNETWQDGNGYSGWAIGKQGYLPMEMVVHALAIQAFQIGKSDPDWADALNKIPRKMFRQSLLWLEANSARKD